VNISAPQVFLMRLLDVAGALVAVVVLAPLFAIAALLILAGDGQPILFRQNRIGKRGEPFLILKFRTMREGNGGLAITTPCDRRVTGVGAWLRALKIDELPQLLNVLRGEMSLIGPARKSRSTWRPTTISGREFWKCPQALRTWLAWRSGMSRMPIIGPSFCRKSFDSICIISGRDRCRAILGCCG
jgi:hypothetical protein